MPRTTSAAPQWSVRTFLFLLVLACLLPGVIGASVLFVREYREARDQLESTTLHTARVLAQAVDYHVLRVQAVAQTLSTAESLARGDLEQFYRHALQVVELAGLGQNVVLRDEAGRQLLNTAVPFGAPLHAPPAPEQVRGVFETGGPTVSDVFMGPVMRRPVMSVDVPVFIDGRVVYALGIGVLPEQINRLLQAQGLPPRWLAGVFDRTGTFAGRSQSAERVVGQKAPPELARAMAQSREGSVEVPTIEGGTVLSSFSRSPFTGWSVTIAIPLDLVEGQLARKVSLLALGVLALFGIGLALARAVGGPLAASFEALIPPATALGRGEPVPVPRVHIREASAVATALGRAGELLAERAATLRARDRELTEAHRLAKFGTWSWNAATGEIEVSDSLRELYGRDVPSFPEQRGTLLTEESWQRVEAGWRESLRTGCGYDLELEVNHGAGHRIWVNAKCETVRDERGEVVALRGTVQDITERKRGDERLRESEERFRLLADNIAQLAWMAASGGDVFWYNRRWLDYTGTTLDDLQGWGWLDAVHPRSVERVEAKIRRCFETGQPWEDTFPLRGADGRYRWFLSRAVPERDAAGRVVRWFGTNTDVTAQRETEEALRKFKFFSDHANDVYLLLDESGRVRYANRHACERLGHAEAELLEMNITDIDPVNSRERFHEILMQSKRAPTPPFESVHRARDGTTYPVEVAVTVLELEGEWLMFLNARDITERKLAEQRVREAALHDSLTGLPNRALVFEYCGRLVAGAQRGHGRGALLFIDLDRFKPINDLYGHEIGDRVLQEVARRLEGCTRDEDLVGRIGGDEFVVVLPHVETERHRAAIVAQHVVERLSRPFLIDAHQLSISPSIGISYFPDHATDVGALVHAADLAMYQAKHAGRANYKVYTPELDRQVGRALSLEARLRDALRNGGLALHYQPVIDLASGRLTGAEALVRLVDGDGKDGDDAGPDDFIPVAESAGLIGALGEWVAAEACRQHELWCDEGLKLTVSINVSPLQFRQRGFAERLGDIIAESGADPHCLEIELTESAVMDSVEDAVAILKHVKSLGVRIALDDFGTGYSSLSTLSSLPLDKLKVDQSFVRRIEGDAASRAVTEAIIALGRNLGLEVVGEGIESEPALRYLREHGCDKAQGFWFSEPLAPAAFALWSRERARKPVAASFRGAPGRPPRA